MTQIKGEGRVVLHESASYRDAMDWMRRYLSDGSGGWKWLEVWRDGRRVASVREE